LGEGTKIGSYSSDTGTSTGLTRMERRDCMLDLMKKAIFTGLGLAFMTKEKIEDFSKELIEKGRLSETEGKEFIDELQKKSEEARKKLEEQIQNAVNNALKKMNIATRDDISRVEKQVAKLATSKKAKKT
jgi:polyhydroxyalkanoate synthesis regulator phasin